MRVGYFVFGDKIGVDWVECVCVFVFGLLIWMFDLKGVFWYVIGNCVVCDMVYCIFKVDVFCCVFDYDG